MKNWKNDKKVNKQKIQNNEKIQKIETKKKWKRSGKNLKITTNSKNFEKIQKMAKIWKTKIQKN